MSDPLIRECENYVLIEPGKPEQILNEKETKEWLEKWLKALEALPEDLKEEESFAKAAQRLIDTACALEIKPGFTLQWFAIRLNPPEV